MNIVVSGPQLLELYKHTPTLLKRWGLEAWLTHMFNGLDLFHRTHRTLLLGLSAFLLLPAKQSSNHEDLMTRGNHLEAKTSPSLHKIRYKLKSTLRPMDYSMSKLRILHTFTLQSDRLVAMRGRVLNYLD